MGGGGPGCDRSGTSGSRSGRGNSNVELSGRGGIRGGSELELCPDLEKNPRVRPEVALGTQFLL